MNKIQELEAEILRIRTTETASAHALDAVRQQLSLSLVPGEHPSATGARIINAIQSLRYDAAEWELDFYDAVGRCEPSGETEARKNFLRQYIAASGRERQWPDSDLEGVSF